MAIVANVTAWDVLGGFAWRGHAVVAGRTSPGGLEHVIEECAGPVLRAVALFAGGVGRHMVAGLRRRRYRPTTGVTGGAPCRRTFEDTSYMAALALDIGVKPGQRKSGGEVIEIGGPRVRRMGQRS